VRGDVSNGRPTDALAEGAASRQVVHVPITLRYLR
jgi:hypothetical protein